MVEDKEKQKKWHKIAFIGILLIGIIVRIYDFGNVPFGLNQDEASMAYDAYADITYGMDRNGDHNPVYAVAWGSGQNMGYNYLVRPFIAIFGLNVYAVRLPMLLLGILSLIVFYFFVRTYFRKKIALLAFFLLSICPWHIMVSRWALESNLVVFLLMFAAFCFVKAKENPGYFIAGMAFSALCIYAYAAAIFFLTLFVPTVFLYYFVKKVVPKIYLLIGSVLFFILALPMFVFIVVNVFNLPPTHFLWFSVPCLTEMRSTATTIFFGDTSLLSAFSNNVLNLLTLLKNMDDGLISNAIPGIGAIYIFLLPFIVLGGIILTGQMKENTKDLFIPYVWLLAAISQALVVIVNINRINILFPMLIVCAAIGLNFLFERIKGATVVTVAVCTISFAVFCGNYFNEYKDNCQGLFFAGFTDAVTYAAQNSTDNVYLTNQVNAPYIFSLYAQKTDPKDYLASVKYDNVNSPFRYVYFYDRFLTGVPADLSIQSGDSYVFHNGDTIPIDINNENYSYKVFDYYTVVLVK